MSRAILNRLSKLEKARGRDGLVHVVPACSDEEYEAKRLALIQAGTAHQEDLFIGIRRFGQEEPFSTGKTMVGLLDHIAQNGRRVHDLRPETAPQPAQEERK